MTNKLTFISPGDPKQRTGGYLYNYEIIKRLNDAGDRVTTIVLEGNWQNISFNDNWNLQLNNICKNEKIIIDAMAWFQLTKATQSTLSSAKELWIIVHHVAGFADTDIQKNTRYEDLVSLNMATNWIVPSKFLKDLINLELNNQKGVVIEPGTYSSHTQQNKNYLNLLSVSHVIPRKGHDNLLKALEKLKKYNWKLTIVGSLTNNRKWAKYIRKLCKELDIENRVKFTGLCNEKELERHYNWAGLLIHTAKFEAYGMVLTEALSKNIPIISTPAGAIDSIYSKAIIKVNKQTLTQKIETWLTNETVRKSAYISVTKLKFPSWNQQAYLFRSICKLQTHSFSSNWLTIREPFDHKSRSKKLAKKFIEFTNKKNPKILDMATGLGSGARFINQLSNKKIQWQLLDNDKKLLQYIKKNLLNDKYSNQTKLIHTNLQNISDLPTNIDGVTTQALLDLTSEEWLKNLSDWLALNQLPLLAALSVNGLINLSISDPHDKMIVSAFQHHQKWDKGFGPTASINAPKIISNLLREKGYLIETCDSNWLIKKNDSTMMIEILNGIAHAAKEAISDVGGHKTEVKNWLQRRLSQVGSMELVVGHTDVLAIPNVT